MTEAEMRALFLLAGLDVVRTYQISNEYCSRACCAERPWWVVATKFGLIKIGWRKNVIAIDWSDTGYRGIVTEDNVTKEATLVHAWGYPKAITYLDTLEHRLVHLASSTAKV